MSILLLLRFDTYFGYYGGAEDYLTHKVGKYLDLHDDVGSSIHPALEYDGKYSTHIYAERATKIIAEFAEKEKAKTAHGSDGSRSSLFMYLAFQAIHSPDEAPQSYIDKFNDTIPDVDGDKGGHAHRRIVAGMISALDEGIGNVTKALKDANMMDDTIIVFTTDNGGPAQGFNSNMASNWPLRGMKRTLWEGGVRGNGFVHGAGLAKTGYVSEALLHAVDLPISLLAVAANGLEADPTDESEWRDWRDIVDSTVGGSASESESEPPLQLGDGLDAWKTLSTGAASPRTEIIHEAHPTGAGMHGKDDGNGQALRMGDYKLILEKGPHWHGPPNDFWYESNSDPLLYSHTVTCNPGGKYIPPPANTSTDYCNPAELPCLFNVKTDPCEYHDLSKAMPDKVKQMVERLADYQATAVPVDFHKLVGKNCKSSDPGKNPALNGTWMPWCD